MRTCITGCFRCRGGGLQLWEAGMARLGRVVPCTYNTGVLLLLLLLLLPPPPPPTPPPLLLLLICCILHFTRNRCFSEPQISPGTACLIPSSRPPASIVTGIAIHVRLSV
jgi:hypothetical protein